ncbi:MAG TPA: RagB/SusD family nutrient uptake outer membrane protein, partial [Chitinophagaceae bacterium]
ILVERRKELVFRTIRFTDIKRLNKEGADITQKRIIGGKTYILLPNDPRYALSIPENVIQAGGIPQNPQN